MMRTRFLCRMFIGKYFTSQTRLKGRFDEESGWAPTLYRYRSAAAEEATREYVALAKQYHMTPVELSLRWSKSRRLVTTSLIGTSSMQQLEENLRAFRYQEELPAQLLWDIDRVHMRNRLPIFSSNRVGKDWYGEGEIGEPIP